MNHEERLELYKQHGFTVFKHAYDAPTMQSWRDEADRLESAHTGIHAQGRNWWFGNMLERAPALMWPAVANAEIVEFLESVAGPFIQLDNLTLAAFPPQDKNQTNGRVSGWHRDRWAHLPSGHYDRPMSFNAICYLQDLTQDNGPLRYIPNSHIEPVTLTPEERQLPHPDEQLIYAEAGDVVLTHHGLLHSGTPNFSRVKRYFFSVYYNLTWLKHTDTFDGPNCRQLIAWATQRNDHRSLRLLGIDHHLQARANSGFQEADEKRWKRWILEDDHALKSASVT